MNTTFRRSVLVILAIAILPACSAINVTPWRAPQYQPGTVKRVAVLPLLLAGAVHEHKRVTSIAFGSLSQQTWTTALSPAQYLPAKGVMEQGVQRAFSGHDVVMPAEVDTAMKDVQFKDVREAVVAVAEKLSVDAVFVFEVRDYIARAAGLESAQAAGRCDLVFYSPAGEPLWTISAEVERGPAGTNAAPSFKQYMDYAMEKLEPEIGAMMKR